MYGTVARARIKSGTLPELLALGEQWKQERAPNVTGAIASYWFQSDDDPNELTIVAIFSDQETYRANANDPEQDAWFQQLRPLLDGDTHWNDGTVVFSGMYSGI